MLSRMNIVNYYTFVEKCNVTETVIDVKWIEDKYKIFTTELLDFEPF